MKRLLRLLTLDSEADFPEWRRVSGHPTGERPEWERRTASREPCSAVSNPVECRSPTSCSPVGVAAEPPRPGGREGQNEKYLTNH